MAFGCCSDEELLARTDVKGVIVVTHSSKARPETVLIDANGMHVVMKYETTYDALLGHRYWCSEVANAIKNGSALCDARCERITLQPRNESDHDCLEGVNTSVGCVNH